MRSISFLMASVSRLDRGKHSNRLILRSRIMNASRKAFSICSGVPATAAGSVGEWKPYSAIGGAKAMQANRS